MRLPDAEGECALSLPGHAGPFRVRSITLSSTHAISFLDMRRSSVIISKGHRAEGLSRQRRQSHDNVLDHRGSTGSSLYHSSDLVLLRIQELVADVNGRLRAAGRGEEATADRITGPAGSGKNVSCSFVLPHEQGTGVVPCS